jgi:predicted  nucleic acid-binding Zn-ribbon protein
MPQDAQLSETLRQIADIAENLGRIEAIERSFNERVKDAEAKITALENDVDKYEKQIERLSGIVDSLTPIITKKTEVIKQLEETAALLKTDDGNLLLGLLTDNSKELRILNDAIKKNGAKSKTKKSTK